MDYKKIAIYAIIILAALGYWYKTRLDNRNKAENEARFASVYAAASVMAQLYRTDSVGFFSARDSIYRANRVDSLWLSDFAHSMESSEEEWNAIWILVKQKTDSLIKYYRAHPIVRSKTDSAELPGESTPQH